MPETLMPDNFFHEIFIIQMTPIYLVYFADRLMINYLNIYDGCVC